jgi:galactose-1-phosphate uridylyltransferase
MMMRHLISLQANWRCFAVLIKRVSNQLVKKAQNSDSFGLEFFFKQMNRHAIEWTIHFQVMVEVPLRGSARYHLE